MPSNNLRTGRLFPGFEQRSAEAETLVEINAVVGGSDPPLLLLHGHPQTLAISARAEIDGGAIEALQPGVLMPLRHSMSMSA